MRTHASALVLATYVAAGTARADRVPAVVDELVPQHTSRAANTAPRDRATPGPDFQRAVTRAVDRSLASSDGNTAIDPVDVIAFRFDSAALDGSDRIELREAARWLHAHPGYRLVVEAHTDAYGTDAYNVGLASRRARAIRDTLGSLGVPRDRVIAAIYGRAKPPSKNPFAAANRVVVIYATTLSPATIAHRTLPVGAAVLWS